MANWRATGATFASRFGGPLIHPARGFRPQPLVSVCRDPEPSALQGGALVSKSQCVWLSPGRLFRVLIYGNSCIYCSLSLTR